MAVLNNTERKALKNQDGHKALLMKSKQKS